MHVWGSKVPCLGAQRLSTIQPSRRSNPRSFACKWRTLPLVLSHDAPQQQQQFRPVMSAVRTCDAISTDHQYGAAKSSVRTRTCMQVVLHFVYRQQRIRSPETWKSAQDNQCLTSLLLNSLVIRIKLTSSRDGASF